MDLASRHLPGALIVLDKPIYSRVGLLFFVRLDKKV